MNRKVIKPVVAVQGFFVAALIVFSIITNQDNKDMTTAMKEATLPIVQFYKGNNRRGTAARIRIGNEYYKDAGWNCAGRPYTTASAEN